MEKLISRIKLSLIHILMEENPYQIADHVQGVGLKTADEIAAKVGIHTDSDFRIRSGIFYVLLQSVTDGHVYLPQEEMCLRDRTYIAPPKEGSPQPNILSIFSSSVFLG